MDENEYSGIISHWCHLFEGVSQSPQVFYRELASAIERRVISHIRMNMVEFPEGGWFSDHRLYLQVWRKNLVFEICAAPFGSGFFVSWWLRQPEGCLVYLFAVPIIGRLAWLAVRPLTYYRLDTALMFQESVHAALLEVVEGLTESCGLRALSFEEKRPIMRGFYDR